MGPGTPRVVIRQAILDFTRTKKYFLNSNGVDFVTSKGIYRCLVFFCSREGERISSFNITGFSLKDLEQELLDCGSLDTLLRQSTEQITTHPLQGKFTGEVIITPDCLEDLIGFLTGAISDGPFISGTSIYRDKLNRQVAAPLFSLHSRPLDNEICDGYFVTADGYAARNSTIVEKGVLKSFLLSLYGSRKTGRPRAANDGGAYVVDPGETDFSDMVRSVEKGILLARFSGESPARTAILRAWPKTATSSKAGRSNTP